MPGHVRGYPLSGLMCHFKDLHHAVGDLEAPMVRVVGCETSLRPKVAQVGQVFLQRRVLGVVCDRPFGAADGLVKVLRTDGSLAELEVDDGQELPHVVVVAEVSRNALGETARRIVILLLEGFLRVKQRLAGLLFAPEILDYLELLADRGVPGVKAGGDLQRLLGRLEYDPG